MKLLDLFCCAGGAGMGYKRAGFKEIIGVDVSPQPKYPYTFVQADALEYLTMHGHEFDAIHASPPCQHYSVATPKANKGDHPDLVGETRQLLNLSGKPYVIENVPGSPLLCPLTLCGSMFGLVTSDGVGWLKRHRLFETTFYVPQPECAHPTEKVGIVVTDGGGTGGMRRSWSIKGPLPIDVVGHGTPSWMRPAWGGNPPPLQKYRKEVMGIGWMNRYELAQAIPPAYTEYVGTHLINHLTPKHRTSKPKMNRRAHGARQKETA